MNRVQLALPAVFSLCGSCCTPPGRCPGCWCHPVPRPVCGQPRLPDACSLAAAAGTRSRRAAARPRGSAAPPRCWGVAACAGDYSMPWAPPTPGAPAAKEQGRGHPVDLGCWHMAALTRSTGGKIPPKHTVLQTLDERKMGNLCRRNAVWLAFFSHISQFPALHLIPHCLRAAIQQAGHLGHSEMGGLGVIYMIQEG